ncbi:Hypothetical predicted protein [Mytilus galloprovincialis]|uniref:COR domain-containing protein n=1 Tax=Mytilus galloprovincialis TaxID=29158 RepID=A0A8B6GV03_MYTGA|nr:Hypothetical predicted protein [Mytilus galloprovincialis]
MAHWGQNLPLKWILLEHLIEINKSDGNNFINFSDMENLAKHSDINMIDIDEVKLFLRFQHEVGNVIYFEDIQDFIILNPKWLVDAFRCLVSDKIDGRLQHRTDWTKFKQNGTISESLITELFKSKCGNQFLDQRENLVKVMEKFDILVKIAETSSYIMPSMMPPVLYDEVCTLIGIKQQNCKRTSWLCLKFSFLPPAFFNHVSVWFIKEYEPSKVVYKTYSMALFRGICVFDIDSKSGCEKILVTMSTDTIAIQLLSFSKRETEFGSKCSSVCKGIIKQIQAIKDRYRLSMSCKIHFKCSKGDYSRDTKSYEDLKNSTEYYCNQHTDVHHSEEIYLPWMLNTDNNAVGRLGGQTMFAKCEELRTKPLNEDTVPWNIRESKPAHPLLVKVSGLRESYREDGIYYSVIRGSEIIIVSTIVETDSDFIIDREYDEHKLNYYKIRSASKNNEGVYNWELKDNSKRGKQTGSFNITICDKERPEPVGESTPPLQYNRQDMDSILTIEENVLEVDGPGSPSLLDKAECVQDRNSPIPSNNSNGANITSSEKCDNMPQKKIDFVEECKHCNLTLTEALNHHGSFYSLSNICHMLDPTTISESHCWVGFVKFYGLMEGFRIKSIEYHKKGNPEDGHMQHILQELLPPLDFRVGHLTYYFSQKHSLREEVLLEIMKFHNNCKFCDICYKTAHSQSN